MAEKKLFNQVADALRVKHYSYRTEQTYVDWIRRYILFHNKRHPSEMGETEVQAFIIYLATERNLSASSQNQALSAILFLYRHILQRELAFPPEIIRAKKAGHLPTVLSNRKHWRSSAICRVQPNLWPNFSTAVACGSWNVCACASRILISIITN